MKDWSLWFFGGLLECVISIELELVSSEKLRLLQCLSDCGHAKLLSSRGCTHFRRDCNA